MQVRNYKYEKLSSGASWAGYFEGFDKETSQFDNDLKNAKSQGHAEEARFLQSIYKQLNSFEQLQKGLSLDVTYPVRNGKKPLAFIEAELDGFGLMTTAAVGSLGYGYGSLTVAQQLDADELPVSPLTERSVSKSQLSESLIHSYSGSSDATSLADVDLRSAQSGSDITELEALEPDDNPTSRCGKLREKLLNCLPSMGRRS